MKFSFKESIGVRFLRVVFGSYLFVTVLITSSQLYVEYSNAEKELLTELFNVAQSFDDGLAKALWNLDNDSIEFILAGIDKIDVIAGVKITGLQDDLQGAIGAYVGDSTNYSNVGIATTENVSAKEIVIRGLHSGTYYEYTLGIVFQESAESPSERIGFMSLYANHDSVIQRFKSSFYLIIIIASIKTIALWLIFLHFARRVVAAPLNQLTAATQTLTERANTSGGEDQVTMIQLKTIANSDNHDELQMLARGFLGMQKSVTEKLDSLYSINDFAVRLSQAASTKTVFKYTSSLLCELFGCRFAVIFENCESIYWASIPVEELTELKIHAIGESNKQYNSRFYDNTITYIHEGAAFPEEVSDKSKTIDLAMLTLPLAASGFEGKQLRFFGPLNEDRLNASLELTKETRSFLQVVAAMVSNTLTNIHQRDVIQQQNQFLEHRVEDRTKELAEVNAELKHLAVHDPLTELPNRTLFNDRLDQLIYQAKRGKRHFAVASIDLTKFKLINDNYGHDAGDAVLIEVSKRFSHVLRNTDTLARMGGDEFAAILTDTHNKAAIETVLEQLIDSLHAPIVLADDTHIIASANIGTAVYPEDATTSDQLFKFADIAMYQAKRASTGWALFDKERNTEEREYVKLMNELELAITREELILHYQPIIDVKTRQVSGLEALVRWVHPVKGMIPPDMFIPHAEKSKHIDPLTYWVIRKACEQCRTLKESGFDLPISVNLSPRVFNSPDLLTKLSDALDEFGLAAQSLKLEITESTAMSNPDKALEVISKFSNLGAHISIDDFGTGHSSLAYLTRLPLNEIKIDKSFLMVDTPNNRVIVDTIIELAHAIGLKVVAEGIETESSLTMLLNKGCDLAQGYFISRPLEQNDVIPFMQKTLTSGAPLPKQAT